MSLTIRYLAIKHIKPTKKITPLIIKIRLQIAYQKKGGYYCWGVLYAALYGNLFIVPGKVFKVFKPIQVDRDFREKLFTKQLFLCLWWNPNKFSSIKYKDYSPENWTICLLVTWLFSLIMLLSRLISGIQVSTGFL